jgi:isopentenyl-diphosphate Delta-isomerase
MDTTMKEELLILVDEDDQEIGVMEKMEAHRTGMLHRAFSVFIFDSSGHMLLQKRAVSKYHSGGLWTNACCSHPRPGEEVKVAAQRRLQEEMGITCSLMQLMRFKYKAYLDQGLIEHELDHVFIGYTDDQPVPNTNEVCDWDYYTMEELHKLLRLNPDLFTAWFRLIFPSLTPLMSIQ